MKKAIIILLALLMILSLAACGGGSASTNTPAPTEAPATPEPTPKPTPEPTEDPAEALAKKVVGVWKWTDGEGPSNGVIDMELYEGGTGKGTNNLMTTGSYYPITWEIKGDVINITASNAPTIGFKYEEESLVSVDSGKTTYTPVN